MSYYPLLHPSSFWDDDFFGFDPFFDAPFSRGVRHPRHGRHYPPQPQNQRLTEGGEGGSGAAAGAAAGEGGDQVATQQQQQMQFPRRRPRFEVHDEKDALTVRAETPGIPKEGLKVSVHDGRLTISGEEKHEERGKGFYQSNFGSFEHSWTLPSHVDGDNLTASYDDGVLHVRLPKRPTPEPRNFSIS